MRPYRYNDQSVQNLVKIFLEITLVVANDTVIYVTTTIEFDYEFHYPFCVYRQRNKTNSVKSFLNRLRPQKAINLFLRLNFREQIRRLALLCTIIVLLLLITGTILMRWHYPGISSLTALLAT